MVYYALLKYLPAEPNYRYLIAAPDADTIDEWWREASAKFDQIKRLAPDFYTFNSGVNGWGMAPSFDKKVMYTLLNDRDGRVMSTISQPPRTDVVSGEAYYIRSKSNPELYWFAKEGLIYATKRGRTRFIFRIDVDRQNDANRTVIIGNDSITISAVGPSPRKYVGVDDNGQVTLTGRGARMYYGDLKKGFLAQGEIDNAGNAELYKSDGYGEEWELVK
ncbi:hypothetical protein FBEOM_929 [Fusarium beomiforme]|uniref:Uncharacterized protein n=1 Tax=Fusarium beomiforme TaxID=44412 RepID=A0A9P5E478_9HYPO|nr:hypothetical protein FBEOM_929 [Fusarium beomiforme]